MYGLTLATKLAPLQLRLLRFQRRRLPAMSALPLHPLPRIRAALAWKAWRLDMLRRRRVRVQLRAHRTA